MHFSVQSAAIRDVIMKMYEPVLSSAHWVDSNRGAVLQAWFTEYGIASLEYDQDGTFVSTVLDVSVRSVH